MDKIVVPPGNLIGRTGEGKPQAAEWWERLGIAKNSEKSGTAQNSDSAASSPDSAAKNGAPGDVRSATSGTGTAKGPAPGTVILRSANKTFDAVVVQTSGIDQFPESKDLLTGRPIYTVYISLGTTKDWALYFCVPGEKPAPITGTRVVQLGAAVPVQAPYPTRLIVPDVNVPAFYKYVLVHGTITAAGRFENLRVVRPDKMVSSDAVIATLSGWEFRSATRDGVKIAVEFLLSIPVGGL